MGVIAPGYQCLGLLSHVGHQLGIACRYQYVC